MICTGGMLKSTAGESYRNVGWETGAEHQGQLPKLCVVGTLRTEILLNSQGETSQGSPQADLSEEMHGEDRCSERHSLSTDRETLLCKQAPASGDDSISMILSSPQQQAVNNPFSPHHLIFHVHS